MNKNVIINAFVTGAKWYEDGQKRLVQSLKDVGYTGDILTWADVPINDYFQPSSLYTIKAAAWHEAVKLGYENILWLDCSVWAVKNPDIFFNEIIENEGYYFWKSGWNVAQSSNDFSLNYVGITRDTAETITEVASSMFGLNMKTEKGQKFYEMFLQHSKAGIFHGSRLHDNQSEDKRFKFHRQDQISCSLSRYLLDMPNIYDQNVYSAYHFDNMQIPESVYFLMRGM